MNKLRSLLALVLALVLAPLAVIAADKQLPAPPEGKAIVYIGKMNAFVGGAAPIHFFTGERYLARVKGKKYLRYVCDPGEHLFWIAAGPRRTFVKAQVEAGRSYALYAKLGAELIPITRESKDWKEFGGMLRGEDSLEIDPGYVAEWTQNHPGYIAQALAEWKAAGEPSLKLLKDEYLD